MLPYSHIFIFQNWEKWSIIITGGAGNGYETKANQSCQVSVFESAPDNVFSPNGIMFGGPQHRSDLYIRNKMTDS